jgi:prepilin-type N-terminal cleavage/methylation domain-containing protein
MITRKKYENGYTLIELVISIVLIGIISSILAYIMVSISGVLQNNRIKKELLLDGYNATARFVREFELVDDESDLLIAGSSQMSFNTIIDGVGYTISYQFSGDELQRRVDSGSFVAVCDNVTGSFVYYQKNHLTITPPLSNPQMLTVRRVRLNLNLAGGAVSYDFAADAFPENYRFSGGGS